MVFIPLQRSIQKVRQEVTEKDIDPADIPFGRPILNHNSNSKRLSYGESLSGSSFTGSSSSYSGKHSGSDSDSCFSSSEDEHEDLSHARKGEAEQEDEEGYAVPYWRYSESITMTERPPYQRRHYCLEWEIQDNRLFRDEVRIQLRPRPNLSNATTYSTTTQCFINSKIRWYRDAIYIIPGAAAAAVASPKRFSSTVFLFPKFPRKRVVSSLEHHSAKTIKWYKVAVELEAKDFVSLKLVHVS